MAKDIKFKDLASTVCVEHGSYMDEKVDFVKNKFPDVSRILVEPDDCSGKVAQFNPELLVRVQKAVKALWPKKQNLGAFELHHNDNMGAAIKFTNTSETVQGVVMPWRI